jgi:hypothetical protein
MRKCEREIAERPLDFVALMARHHDGAAGARGERGLHGAPQQRAPVKFRKQLVLRSIETLAAPGGEHNGRDGRFAAHRARACARAPALDAIG